MNYYNECDSYAAEWLRNLIGDGAIPPGHVDTRSITEVTADDLRGYTQCHFFAGIGGWSLALKLAGFPPTRPVWTGSCPCQPFSAAGKQKGVKDERHLWPVFCKLIEECRPPVIFGEQVASAIRHGWLDGVYSDLEAKDYAVGAIVLGAHSVGSPHIRQRLFWVADSSCDRWNQRGSEDTKHDRDFTTSDCSVFKLGHATSLDERRDSESRDNWQGVATGGSSGPVQLGNTNCRGEESFEGVFGRTSSKPGGSFSELGDTDSVGLRTKGDAKIESARPTRSSESPLGNFATVNCRDGKTRRIPGAQSGIQPLSHGLPRNVGTLLAGVSGVDAASIRDARRNRVGQLKGYGNAIVPQVAAEFIRSVMEAGHETGR